MGGCYESVTAGIPTEHEVLDTVTPACIPVPGSDRYLANQRPSTERHRKEDRNTVRRRMSFASGGSQGVPFGAQNALLTASVRARTTDSIKPFEEGLVRTLQRETRAFGDQLTQAADHFRQQQEAMDSEDIQMDPGTVCALKMSASTARHNKRILLAYAMQRRNAILDAYWACSGSVANTLLASSSNVSAEKLVEGNGGEQRVTDGISKVLTPVEQEYLRAHSTLVHDLAKPYHAYTVNLLGNLAGGPSRGLFIQVECLRDLGEVAVGAGGAMIQFEVGSRYFVKRSEVERLIEGGWLMEIDGS
ncbi:hypothetical protein PCANC_09054 [Puccinia coronata f. sp. avenae]|uniref:DNA replication complex GINS protein PSF1 n=1 Tax=Puccinia coronata f. sp. avenae TaxID=200324 RepID=A0A2N5T209_9BASI|nr:hypothetical protein PCANC_09054 [Puccinia coronata f. sp. avenae]